MGLLRRQLNAMSKGFLVPFSIDNCFLDMASYVTSLLWPGDDLSTGFLQRLNQWFNEANMFTIDDELHCELQGDFPDLEAAAAELRRRAAIPWDCEPNLAPCTSWRTCGRRYQIIEYIDDEGARELRRIKAIDVSASGIVWHI